MSVIVGIQVRDEEGRLFRVDAVGVADHLFPSGRALCTRLDRRAREQKAVFRDLAVVEGWQLVDPWVDRESSSVHVDGHKVGLMSGPGQAPEWWFHHRDYRRVRLQMIGPEPRGPFRTREEAKAALDDSEEGGSHGGELAG